MLDHPLIGPDLVTLIARQPAALVETRELTSIRSGNQGRASFRLTFEDGRVLKGRRFRKLERCQIATVTMGLLQDLPLNKVIDVCGDSWLEEWIAGVALQPADTTDPLCRWAGSILGRIHAVNIGDIEGVPAAPDSAAMLRTLDTNLVFLARAGALLDKTCDALQRLATEELPGRMQTGLVHTDFTVENFVLDEFGQYHVIDNEHLVAGALDYDLVKTFCRWPMTPAQRRAFCEGYGQHGDVGGALSHGVFWSILALAQSARVRCLHHLPCEPLLERLQDIAAGQRDALWPVAAPPIAQTA